MARRVNVLACSRVSLREADIFPFWLEHYRPHVDEIAVLVIAEPDDPVEELEQLCTRFRAHYKRVEIEWFQSRRLLGMLGDLVTQIPAEWIIHADSDEFLYEVEFLPEIISELQKEGAGYASAAMVDRFAVGGWLASVPATPTFAALNAAFPIRAAITQGLAQANSYKACLSRWPFMGKGHAPAPEVASKRSRRRLTLEHFKWRIGLEQRLRKRIADHAKTGVPWGVESERILGELETFGRIRVENWPVSSLIGQK